MVGNGCPPHRGLPQGLVRWLCLLVPARTPRHDWMVGGEIRAQKKLNLRSLCTCANPTLRSQAPACLLHLGLPWRRGPNDKKVQTTGQTAQPASISSTKGGKPCNTIRFVQSRNAPAAQPGRAGLWHLKLLHLGRRPTLVPRSSTGMDDVRKLYHGNRPVSTHADEAPVSTLDVYQIRDCLAPNACATQSAARVPASHLAGGLTVALCF